LFGNRKCRVDVVNPRIGAEEVCRRQRHFLDLATPFRQAAPWPILRASHESGAKSVPFDVSARVHEFVCAVERH